ncbi:chromosome segregation protein SMC [Xylanibacillus composti]|uniref:Chromosome partition protein Smc n=1 Tax=Xylanibacillus composti TaxID=1572762 RepID=A0A8J4M289_9BACL|nr:chromosome segregation protein SMC [Xylanibacillus composti]MDT9724127.1 chromosome segregation protein SMC [Xylanibacillus composti]GIQ68677.1 chromosome partition protein Smc [Xylanibacillus composti]
MFLKRLELYGFKSFADRTELEFVPGITAVVGPNGSGKSNISDSIRWVLGEQSAKSLRGGNMQDIIFAGSDTRKAVNYGEVSLTLDNSDQSLQLDYNEVTVTRRIHRSGESEYFINKQACRLRDITELFMDTGIGKEAYSIIGQGRIEEILSTRSEDRRGIFEEASGIVKYKSRKKEAQKKLDDTEQNLLRLHDLVSELDDQVEPLREQSEKALRFRALKEELKQKEISLYVHQIEQIHQSWSEAGERLKQLQDEEAGLTAVVSGHDAHLESFRLDTRRLEERLEQLQNELLHVSEETEKAEGQTEVLKERKRHLESEAERHAQTAAQLERRKDNVAAEQRDVLAKLEDARQRLTALEQAAREEEARLAGVTGNAATEAEERLKAELLDLLNETAGYRNELRYTEQQLEQSARRRQRLAEEKTELEKRIASCRDQQQEWEEKMQKLLQELESVKRQHSEQQEHIRSTQGLYNELGLTVRKWEQKRDSLISRRDTLKELQDDYDGFAHGVREILKARKKAVLPGIHGAVAELMKVPAEVEIAIETALGGALQHIVMENEAASREAIQYLKRRQLGRATFLPLDVIKGRAVQDADRRQAEQVEGYIGIAADLIQTDPEYDKIMRSLLGNVIIAQSLEQANRIAARCQYRYRVVTLEGDVVNAGGSMTGGSQNKRNTGLLSRQRQLENIEKEIGSADQQLVQLRDKWNGFKQQMEEQAEQLEQLRSRGEQIRIQEQQMKGAWTQLAQALDTLNNQLGIAADEDKQQMEEAELLKQKCAELQESLTRSSEAEEELQRKIEEAERLRKASLSAKEELQEKLTSLRVEAASATEEKRGLEDRARRLNAELEEVEEAVRQNREQAERIAQEQLTQHEEFVRVTELLNELRIRKANLTADIEAKRLERIERLRKLEEEESETKEQRVQLKQVQEQLHHTEVRVNRLDVELENLLKKLAEDYELSYELAKSRYPVPEDVLGTQNEVRELKRQITMLGDVNLGAIDEYQRVKERYEFLSAQRDDLVSAKQALYKVIKELEDEMSKRFLETFQQIREHFSVVFAKLFGGGRADLILTDMNNLLETGVDIVAQPPGKKLQNLQLLSGGERALTAMALLFAILNVKPVPFCVLDEVEAALDEANVSRFAEYLREFSESTQFIVVTHRKGTMEEADVLYGVAMEESGVSKLVSVRLDDEEQASA